MGITMGWTDGDDMDIIHHIFVKGPGTSAHSEDGRSGMKLVPFSLYTDYTLAAC